MAAPRFHTAWTRTGHLSARYLAHHSDRWKSEPSHWAWERGISMGKRRCVRLSSP
jgi:hypothetical protein